jgi:hypothetical protein
MCNPAFYPPFPGDDRSADRIIHQDTQSRNKMVNYPKSEEKLLKAQDLDGYRQAALAWKTIQFLTGQDPHELVGRFEALLHATAFSIAKDAGYDNLEQALPEAMKLLGVD